MNEIVDRLWTKTREHIGDLLTQAEQSIVTMRTLVQRAETAADNAEQGAPPGGWPAEDLGPHEHPQSQVIGLGSTLAGKADLVGGHVPTSQIPALALTKPFVVQDRAGMLALEAQEGDVAVIQGGDDQGTYMLGDGPSGVYESWVALASSVDVPVQSVNGQVGTVVLGASDVGASTLTLGTTASTAKAGNYHPTWAQVTGKPATITPAAVDQKIADKEPLVVNSLPTTPLTGRIYLVRES